MSNDLIIIGSGGLAQEYAWLVEEINEDRKSFNLLGYLDDDPARRGQEFIGYPVLGTLAEAERFSSAALVIGVGDPRARREAFRRAGGAERRWTNLISPTARVHRSNSLGVGVIVGRYADMTVGCEIGDHVMINIHAVLGHAVTVGRFSVVSPNVTINGEAQLGEGCYVGANAFIRNVRVGDWATVGASASVTKDVEADCVVVGVPARVLHSGAPQHKLTKVPDKPAGES